MVDRKDDEGSPQKRNPRKLWMQNQNIQDERVVRDKTPTSPHHRLTQRRMNMMSEQVKNYWALRKAIFTNARLAAKSLRRARKYINAINNSAMKMKNENKKKKVKKAKKQNRKSKQRREPVEFNSRTENTRALRARRAARRAGRYRA